MFLIFVLQPQTSSPRPVDRAWIVGILVLALALRLPGLNASLWLDEATSPSLFLGAALAISGMALMHLGRRRAERRSRQQASAGKT